MTGRIIQLAAVVVVSIVMMTGPAVSVVTIGDGAPDTVDNTASCPVHPADDCTEDESWTAVHHDDPRGQTTPDNTVSRACIHNDDVTRHLDDVTRSMNEWTRHDTEDDGR